MDFLILMIRMEKTSCKFHFILFIFCLRFFVISLKTAMYAWYRKIWERVRKDLSHGDDYFFFPCDRPYDTLLTGPQLYPLEALHVQIHSQSSLCGAAHPGRLSCIWQETTFCPSRIRQKPNYAETAREMVLSGDWISPQIYGRFWYDKPIFYYWELAASFAVFGFNEAAARLPAAIMGTASLLFTYWFSRKVYGEKIGWLSALIFGVSVETWILSKSVITDTTLYLFMSAAVAFFYLGYAENRKYYYLCYVAAAFATLTKGPIGILLPGLGCVLFLLYKKDIREMLHVHLISGLILFALIGAPWYGIMWHIHGNDFILNFLGVHNFLRATVSEHPSHNTWYFYIIVYLVGFLPWSIFIPYSLYKRWKERKLDFRSAKDATQLLAFYALGVFVFFELIATKYTTYTFPALFSMAILTAILYQNISLRIEKAALGTFVVLIALTFLAAPSIMLKHSGKEVGLALKHMNTGEAPLPSSVTTVRLPSSTAERIFTEQSREMRSTTSNRAAFPGMPRTSCRSCPTKHSWSALTAS